jgi:Glu/Leu/Phe/Val dehydrogenase, dimerisation domain
MCWLLIGDDMAGEPLAGRGGGGPEIVELSSVPGFVVFDLPGVPVSAGGTRLAPDVSAAEVALLARAMTYKFAALGDRVGGAKAGVRGDPADRAGKDALMAAVDDTITGLILAALRHHAGPLAGACELAGRFLRGWWGEPPDPPFAPGTDGAETA